MYVTKKNMETAVTNLKKHLEHVSDALSVSLSFANVVLFYICYKEACVRVSLFSFKWTRC